MRQATPAAHGPKYNPPRLIITDRPSKIRPGPMTKGRSIPITAAPPKIAPCSNAPRRVSRFHRRSTNPLTTLSAINSARL